ncbi:hypothetical protein D877_gp11 [Edwardsiella phage KF-1]|uniref:Polymer-forming cytoskeletal protein n=1 Tax=Edwardsiella phage KF-1 TaxID=1244856 RepID=K4Q356_9CAUD|nr:hypothetical protein D877_gp11 [Edwardsiella phage KF-1]BAM63059.1 hypothetical protein [Edwardsiella phage KF-1]
MTKKYELLESDLTTPSGATLYRVKALKDFGNVKAGDIGGYIGGEHNLSHNGSCWVSDEALVSDNAWVSGNAKVSGNARVFGEAWVSDDARVSGNARVFGDAWVSDDAECLSSVVDGGRHA